MWHSVTIDLADFYMSKDGFRDICSQRWSRSLLLRNHHMLYYQMQILTIPLNIWFKRLLRNSHAWRPLILTKPTWPLVGEVFLVLGNRTNQDSFRNFFAQNILSFSFGKSKKNRGRRKLRSFENCKIFVTKFGERFDLLFLGRKNARPKNFWINTPGNFS